MSLADNAVRAALGLGSNMGDPKANLAAAIARLDASEGISVLAVSSAYRTPPWGPIPQDDYRNICLVIETVLSPRDLLGRCLEIERELGRVRDVRWGPRIIDIDVLIYGGEQVEEEHLSIPHPRMGERAFVLVPLAEIWPDAPIGGGRSAAQALATCEGREEIVLLAD
ncbi:2-amino-4-hydroxy-6-hydroxymethyldihydropteridine diphosphokinase [Pannonibacter phragmitetus]|uniref:2-amino-4-hydroxy-6-hydroxymethyldihydropteridine pyrophosphokinase n=1 Tax=Pannonibacter phragmitetus TaxID=121719 RepID=A0A0U3MRV5_9HYPH|nr:2-amino-4-hydroxy-6-hydroxymethyldihydropteridine diphosphokinase [Pannonibacter phragmitetus]ALV26951.1 2-amino-4-hydroxy-6-hydroxymethyldihydropteridine pyrophosphokinase [Pannonibacter phragmitetus]